MNIIKGFGRLLFNPLTAFVKTPGFAFSMPKPLSTLRLPRPVKIIRPGTLFVKWLLNPLQDTLRNLNVVCFMESRTKKATALPSHSNSTVLSHGSLIAPNSTPRRKKPAVARKWFKSDVLNKKFLLYVSNKAKRTIEKYGGFDDYIMKCSHRKLCSDFGSELKRVIAAKLADPSAPVPYIPTTAKVRVSKVKKELRRT